MIFVPPELIQIHKNVLLTIDVMFVNSHPFFVSISRNIKFTTIQALPNRTHDSLMIALKAILGIYNKAGFHIQTVLADGEFEHLRPACVDAGIHLNTTSANEHVIDIERQIRVLKERARAIWTSLPFRSWPKRMIYELMAFVVFWLNSFPNRNGISKTLSPRMILTGTSVNFKAHYRMPFGGYAQVHEDPEHTNDVTYPRTQGCIYLGPSGNSQGGYKFLSLTTGRKILRRSFTELPMPQDVIDRIHLFAKKRKTN